MSEEEYLRFKNLLGTVIEQQAVFAENQAKADTRMARHEEAIASLLTIAEMHESEIKEANERMNARFEEITATFAETDERINALVSIVDRYISKN